MPIVESNTAALPQSNTGCVPHSSTYSSDPELNNALDALIDKESISHEDTVTSDGMAPDPLFSASVSLPQTTDLLPQSSNILSRESSSMRVDTLQPPTSTAHGTISGSLLPVEESGTTGSSRSNSCVPPSSTYSSSDSDFNDALHALTRCSQENSETFDGNIFNLFFPLIPFPQPPDLLPQRTSQFVASKEQEVDTIEPSKSSEQSHQSSLATSRSNLPSSPELPSLSYSSPELHSVNSTNSSRDNMPFGSGWISPFDLLSLFPLPESVDSLSQGTSQPSSTEQTVHLPTSTAHGTVFTSQPVLTEQRVQPSSSNANGTASECLPVAVPIVESNTSALPQSNTGCVPHSASTYSSDPELNNVVCALIDNESCGGESIETSNSMDPYIFDFLFQVPLVPLPQTQTTNLPPQSQSSQSASMADQRVDTLQPILSTAHSVPSSLDCSYTTEKMMEPFFDLFSLFPLPQTTNLLPQESSSREHGVDTLQLVTSAAPLHHLPVDQTTDVQMSTSSSCTQSSHSSSVYDGKDNASACTHTDPDPSHSLEESIQVTLEEQAMTSPLSSTSPSTEAASQVEEQLNVEAQDCTDKPKKSLSVNQQQRQRMLNKVSALHYRRRKKERKSDLELRREQLEAENTRLKEQVSFLTTEIARWKRLSKTQKAKICPFFLHSTCNKIK